MMGQRLQFKQNVTKVLSVSLPYGMQIKYVLYPFNAEVPSPDKKETPEGEIFATATASVLTSQSQGILPPSSGELRTGTRLKRGKFVQYLESVSKVAARMETV